MGYFLSKIINFSYFHPMSISGNFLCCNSSFYICIVYTVYVYMYCIYSIFIYVLYIYVYKTLEIVLVENRKA